jgi:hypothetical protein
MATAAAVAVAVGCAIAALACVLVALWIYVLPRVGAVGAPLVIAGALVLVGLAVLALLRYAPTRHPPPPAASVAPSLLLAEATHLLKTHKTAVLAGVLLAGLLAGRSDRDRNGNR